MERYFGPNALAVGAFERKSSGSQRAGLRKDAGGIERPSLCRRMRMLGMTLQYER